MKLQNPIYLESRDRKKYITEEQAYSAYKLAKFGEDQIYVLHMHSITSSPNYLTFSDWLKTYNISIW